MYESARVKSKFAIDSSSTPTQLELWVARYAFNGTFLGYSAFDKNMLLCHVGNVDDIYDAMGIAHNFYKECDYNLSQIFNFTETAFYEMYILDRGADSGSDLIDVPVRIKNYDGSTNKDDYKYVRRFFLYDNICKDQASDSKYRYIRWAYKMELRIELKKGSQEEIYVPTLTIEYRERSTDYVSSTNSMTKSSMRVIYYMDTSSFLLVAVIFLIVLTVIALVISAYRIYIWWQTNPSNPPGLHSVIVCIVTHG